MGTQLYPHNQEAYEKVMEAFKTSNRTCICHPTGTGKSYIVAAVCQHFEKVLVLAPNMFVLNQQEEALKGHKSVSYMTYAWLLLHYSEIKTKYDIIVLDEFHRAGAEEWGTAVELLLESQPQAKILGTSATPIRYLDNGKNMAKELFNNNIASTLSIAEAWHQGILPIPTYVAGFLSFENTINDAVERIKRSKLFSEQEKVERLHKISNMMIEWQKSSGMVSILKKHLNKDMHRIIVFCAHINNLQAMQRLVKKWFRQAGFSVSDAYTIHSDQSDNMQIAQMKDFSQNTTKGIKLLFAINILNEGVHIPNVDAVLFLRTTSSRIVYLQQLGRCLTAASTDTPLVLDMVNNISTTTVTESLIEDLAMLESGEGNTKKTSAEKTAISHLLSKFKVFDYTLNIKQMIKKLTTQQISLDERIEAATRFCELNGRAPSAKYPEEYGQLLNWKIIRKFVEKDSRVLELFAKYSNKNKLLCVFKKQLIDFVKEYDRFPSSKRKTSKEEHNLYHFFHHHKEELLKDLEINKIYQKYSSIDIKYLYYKKTLEFCKIHGRYPRKRELSEREAYIVYQRFKDAANKYEKYKLLYKTLSSEYGKHSRISKYIEEVRQYAMLHGYLPCSKKEEIYRPWKMLKHVYKDNPEVIELIKKYDAATRQRVSYMRGEAIKKRRQNIKFRNVDLQMKF